MAPNLQALHRQAARISQSMGVSFRKLRYGTTELSINPRIKDMGELAKRSTARSSNKRFFQYYEAFIDVSVFEDSGIAESALAIGQTWQMSNRAGDTWINLFINSVPIEQSARYQVEFAKYIADANLTVTYQVGQGTFSTVEGNEIEDTDPAQFTALVSQPQRPTIIELPGLPSSAIYLEGFHRSPTASPAQAPTNERLDATLTNGTGQSLAGSFTMLPSVQPAIDVDGGRGDLLRGYFVLDGSDLS